MDTSATIGSFEILQQEILDVSGNSIHSFATKDKDTQWVASYEKELQGIVELLRETNESYEDEEKALKKLISQIQTLLEIRKDLPAYSRAAWETALNTIITCYFVHHWVDN